MEKSSDFDEGKQRFSLSHAPVGFTFKYRYVTYLLLVLVVLGLGVSGLGACGLPSGGEPTAATSTPVPTSAPRSVPSPAKNILAPTPTNTPTPTPAPPPTSIVATPATLVTPTPIPTSTSEGIAVQDAEHYEELIAVEGASVSALHKAYNLLSPELRDQLSFDEFLNNSNYTLQKGCWRSGQVTDSPIDSSTLNVSIIMQQVSCVDGNVFAYYSWNFRVQMVDGLPEIVSIGLYPTASGN